MEDESEHARDDDSIASDNTRATSNVRALVVPERSDRKRLPQYDIGQDRSRSLTAAGQQQTSRCITDGRPQQTADSRALVAHEADPGTLANYGVEDSRSLVLHERSLTDARALTPSSVETVAGRAITPSEDPSNEWAITPAEDPPSSIVEAVDERAIAPSEGPQSKWAITPVEDSQSSTVETVDERAITPVEDTPPSRMETADERAITPVDGTIVPRNESGGVLVETVDDRALTPVDAGHHERALVPQSSEETALIAHDGKDSENKKSKAIVPREKSKFSRKVVPHKKSGTKATKDADRKSSSSSSRELTRSGSSKSQKAIVPLGDAGSNPNSKAIVPKEKISSSSALVPKDKSSSSRSIVPTEKSGFSRSIVPKEKRASSHKSAKKDEEDTKKEAKSQDSPQDTNTAESVPNVEGTAEKKDRDSGRHRMPTPDHGFSSNSYTPESMVHDSADGDTWMDYDEGTITTNLKQSAYNPNENAQYDYDYDSTAGDSSVRAARYQQQEEDDDVAYEVDPEFAVDDGNGNEDNSKRSARSRESYQQEHENYHPDQRGSRHSRPSQRDAEEDPRSYREDSGPSRPSRRSNDTYPVNNRSTKEDNFEEETYEEANYEDANSFYSASDQSDDSSTIKTYGSNYWSSLSQAKKEAAIKPATIYEDEEMSQNNLKKPVPSSTTMDEASYSGDSYTKGTQSVSGRSIDSSQYTTSTGTRSSGMGIVQRPGTARTSRRNDSREVEVSMDGFMHQSKRSVEDSTLSGTNMSGSHGSYSYMFQEGDKVQKLTPLHMYASLLAIMVLLVTVLFFAAHIGPFEVDTRIEKGVRGTQAAGMSNVVTAADAVNPNEGSSSLSSALAVDGSESFVDQAWQVPAENGGVQVVGVPLWIRTAFMNTGRAYLGTNLEIPFIWTISLSGGDIVSETMSRCLAKVIAGDGYKYDINDLYTTKFTSDMFQKLSSVDGHNFINVDLFSLEGITRAGRLGLTQLRISDLAYTPILKESAEKLFVPVGGKQHPEVAGRLLVIARDPIERALHVYERARVVTGNNKMTLSEFLDDPNLAENNPFTRRLLGISATDPLTSKQQDVAKSMLHEYAWVGLFDKVEESILRFEKLLKWYPGDIYAEVQQCHINILASAAPAYEVVNDANTTKKQNPSVYNRLVGNYLVDLEVYKIMKDLYHHQGKTWFEESW